MLIKHNQINNEINNTVLNIRYICNCLNKLIMQNLSKCFTLIYGVWLDGLQTTL